MIQLQWGPPCRDTEESCIMTMGDGSSMWNDTAGGMINDIPPNMHSGDEAAFYYNKG